MRNFFFVLIALNAVVFAQLMGWMPNLVEDAREPQRLRQQLAPGIARPVSLDAAANTSSTLPPLPAPPTECFDIGPLTPAEAEALQATITRTDPTIKFEMTQLEDGASYMVVTSTHANLREAQRREQQLRALGVRETYAIQDGNLKNAVSLGIFSTKESADSLMAALRAKGADDLSIVPRANPMKAGVRITDVPQQKIEVTRRLLLQLPVRSCNAK